jgi:hypothetical protein
MVTIRYFSEVCSNIIITIVAIRSVTQSAHVITVLLLDFWDNNEDPVE